VLIVVVFVSCAYVCIFIDLFCCLGMSLLNGRALVVGIGELLQMILHRETVISTFCFFIAVGYVLIFSCSLMLVFNPNSG